MLKRIILRITLIMASVLLLAPLAYAQVTQTDIQKLLASDKASENSFGWSVAIDGEDVRNSVGQRHKRGYTHY